MKKYPGMMLVLPFAVSLLFIHDHMTVLGEDAAAYMLLAKSLWSGSGYRTIWAEGAPIHVHFPPLLPLIMAPFWGLFGKHLLPAHLLMSIFYVLSAWLGYRLLRRRMSALPAAVWMTFVVTSPLYLELVGVVNTEHLYSVMVLAGLLLLDGEAERPAPSAWLGALLLSAFAFLTRSIGFTLFLAAAVFAFIQHGELKARSIRCLASLAALALVVLTWTMWTRTGTGGRTYMEELMLKDPYAAGPVRAGLGDLMHRFADNVIHYGAELTTLLTYEAALVRRISAPLFAIGCALMIGIVLMGWWRWVKTRRSAAPVYLLIYFGPILIWFWQYTRFMFPVLILTGICLGEGLVAVVEKVRGKDYRQWAERAILWIAAVLILGNLVGIAHDLRQPMPAPIANFFRIHESIRAHLSPEEVAVSRKAAITSWLTGLKTRGLVGELNTDQAFDVLDGAHWLVMGEIDPKARASIGAALYLHPERFKHVAEEGPTVLFRILPRPQTAQSPLQQHPSDNEE